MEALYIIGGIYVSLVIVSVIYPFITKKYNPELQERIKIETIDFKTRNYSLPQKIILVIFQLIVVIILIIFSPIILPIVIYRIKKKRAERAQKAVDYFERLGREQKEFKSKLSKIYLGNNVQGMHYTDIIYLDDNKSSPISLFFKKNADEVARLLAKKNYRFIYFPHVIDFIKVNGTDVTLQNYPFLKKKDVHDSPIDINKLQFSLIEQFDFMEYASKDESGENVRYLIPSPDCKEYCLNSFIQYKKDEERESEEKATGFTDFIKTEIDDKSNIEYPDVQFNFFYAPVYFESYQFNSNLTHEMLIWAQIYNYIKFLEKPLTVFRYTETNPLVRESNINYESLENVHTVWKDIQINIFH